MRQYKSYIQHSERVSIDVSFTLTKRLDCKTDKLTEIVVDKLERLKKEDFNRVLIPEFNYNVDGNIVIYDVEFIKGYGIPMFIPELSKIIYEDVVNRKSDWTLCDYSNDNFIIDANTNTLYAIDFQSYGYYPDVNRRIKMWDNYNTLNKMLLDQLSNGKWNIPARSLEMFQ
jgi:3-methyladenine DNA glycosylase AlkD